MVGAAAVAAAANVIYNPGFAHGLRGWRTVVVKRGLDPRYPRISAVRAPSGPLLKCAQAPRHHPYLQIEVPGGADGYVEQSIIVPVRPRRLRFRAWGALEPVKATVSIFDGLVVHRLLSFSPPPLLASTSSCSHLKPVTESLNLTRYAGQAVGLRIQASGQGLAGTRVDFDSLVLTAR